MRNYLMMALFTAMLVSPLFAHADPIDGASPCLCAVTKIVECDSQGDCQEVTPEVVNIPMFIKVDFKKNILSGFNSTDSRKTAIKAFEQADGHVILQGGENQRAWSMMVTSETGSMSASVSGENYGFLLFGGCTLLPQ